MKTKFLLLAIIVSLFAFSFVFAADEDCYSFNNNLYFSPLAEIVSLEQPIKDIQNLQRILKNEDLLEDVTGEYDLETVKVLEKFQEEKKIKTNNSIVKKGVIFSGSLRSYFNEEYGCDSTNLENRKLLVLMSNNYLIPEELSNLHKQNEFLFNYLLSMVFNIDRSKLSGLSLEEIIVEYGEPFLAEEYKMAANNYGEVVILTGKKATYNNFKETIRGLDSKNATDLLINLHGNEDSFLFYDEDKKHGESIDKEKIAEDLNNLNIGFVYQTVCWGSENMDVWLKAGGEVVNGAKARNDFVILSPIKFLEEWTEGKSFKEAVESGYSHEKSRLSLITNFVDKDLLNPKNSEMIFLGETDYRIE